RRGVSTQRDIDECGRPHHLARALARPNRVLPADAAGTLGGYKAARVSPGPHSRSVGKTHRQDCRGGACRRDPQGARRALAGRGDASAGEGAAAMTAFLIENIGPLMFGTLVIVLLW